MRLGRFLVLLLKTTSLMSWPVLATLSELAYRCPHWAYRKLRNPTLVGSK
jgi:hypothetical protein